MMFVKPRRSLSKDNTINEIVVIGNEIIPMPTIKQVIFKKPYTIIKWSDNTQTVVKDINDNFNEELGLSMAISRKYSQIISPHSPRATFKSYIKNALYYSNDKR